MSDTIADLLQHIRLFHAHQPCLSIRCGIGGCERTFTNFGTYQNHISGYHRSESNPTNVINQLSENSNNDASTSGIADSTADDEESLEEEHAGSEG